MHAVGPMRILHISVFLVPGLSTIEAFLTLHIDALGKNNNNLLLTIQQ